MDPVSLAAFAVIAVCIASAVWHLLSIPELDDEFMAVDFIGSWFSTHLLSYLFQWQMWQYPPRSPIFGNGFLPPYLFGVSIALLHAHVPALYAARAVNLVLSFACACVVFAYLRTKLPAPYPILGAALFLSLPVVLYGAATAYYEPSLGLEFALLLYLVDGDRRGSWRKAFLIGAVLACGLLTKLSIAVPWALVAVRLAYLVRVRRTWSSWQAIVAMILPFVLTVVVWPGAREPQEIAGIIHFFVKVRDDMGLLPRVSPMFNLTSYAIMTIASVGSGILVAWLACLLIGWRQVARSPRFLCLLGAVVFYLLFLGLAVHGSTRHQIITVQPFVTILIVFAFAAAMERVRAHSVMWASALHIGVLAAAVTTVALLSGPNVGLYVSSVADAANLQAHFLSGSGELQGAAAEWIRSHARPPYHVCSLAQDHTMPMQDPGIGKVGSLFIRDDAGTILQRNCGFLVLYDSYFKGTGPLISLLRQHPPVHVIDGKSVKVLIYRVRRQSAVLRVSQCGLAECRPPQYMALRQAGATLAAHISFPKKGAGAAVLTISDVRYTGADAFRIAFDYQITGCSVAVADATLTDGPLRWEPGMYTRIFRHRNCRAGNGASSNTDVDVVLPAQEAVGEHLAIRVGTDATYSTIEDLRLSNLQIRALSLNFETTT